GENAHPLEPYAPFWCCRYLRAIRECIRRVQEVPAAYWIMKRPAELIRHQEELIVYEVRDFLTASRHAIETIGVRPVCRKPSRQLFAVPSDNGFGETSQNLEVMRPAIAHMSFAV